MRFLLEELFPYIVLLYFTDCIAYIKQHHLLFFAHFKRYFLKRSGFHLVGLSPVAEVFLSDNLPILLASSGVYVLNNEYTCDSAPYRAEDFHFIAYRDMALVEAEGKEVKINGQVFLQLSSSIRARQIMHLIQKLKELTPEERPAGIQAFLAQATDLQKIEALRTAASNSFFCLKLLCSALFVITFILFPLVLYSKVFQSIHFHFLVLLLGFNYLWILILTFSIHRRIYDSRIGQGIHALLPIILSPVSAIHVPQKLTREMYVCYDPLTIAAAFLSPESFRDLIRKELYRIRRATVQQGNVDIKEALNLKENSLYNLLAKHGTTLDELFAAPEKQDEAAGSYCPFCRTEYRSGFNICCDCNISLEPYR